MAGLDRELADLPPQARRREWRMRVEAAIFAAAAPLPPEALADLPDLEALADAGLAF